MTALDYTNCCQEYPGKSVPESLVCTPYCTRPWTFNKTNQDWVKWIESGGDTKYYTSECTSALTGSDNIYFTSTAWYDYSYDPKKDPDDQKKNYFVFHFLDGAGIQSDYAGDVKYVEQFGPNCDGYSSWENDGRKYTTFYKECPKKTYKWCNSGWWISGCDGHYPDGSPKTNKNGIPDWMVSAGCNKDGSRRWWGSGSHGRISDLAKNIPNPYFQWHDPAKHCYAIQFILFGWREADCPGKKAWDPVEKEWVLIDDGRFDQYGRPNLMQFADNEPETLSDDKSPGWPPYIAVYHMLLCDADKGPGERYIKGQVHVLDDDDKFCSDGNEFFLKECTPW